MIENLSATMLVNFHIWNLEGRGEDGASMIDRIWNKDLYNLQKPVYIWHDIGPKRWNVLLHLIDILFERSESVRMLEVGVDTANVTERLLSHYSGELDGRALYHVGIDPWMNNVAKLGPSAQNGDQTFALVQKKLAIFGDRSMLHRMKSLDAAKKFRNNYDQASNESKPEGQSPDRDDELFDIIFLDAMHDFFSVTDDIL